MMFIEDVCYEYEQLFEDDCTVILTGSPDLAEFLHAIPAFCELMKTRGSKPGVSIKKRSGRHAVIAYSDEVETLVQMIYRLYADNGLELDTNKQGSLRKSIEKAMRGENRFFDFEKGRYWLDMLSALERECHVFSGGAEQRDFSAFCAAFIAVYAHFERSRQVAFYIRWISRLAALYTVYTGQPYAVYEQVRKDLLEAHARGLRAQSASGCHPDMSTHLLKNELFVYLVTDEKQELLQTIREFIYRNPIQFVADNGRVAGRYRRYYSLIRAMLEIALAQGDEYCPCENEALLSLFLDENASRAKKDRSLHALEYEIFCRLNTRYYEGSDPEGLLDYLVGEQFCIPPERPYQIKRELADDPGDMTCRRSNCGNYEVRPLEEVADSVVKLLRLYLVMIKVHKEALRMYPWETMSASDLIDEINVTLAGLGVATLPLHPTEHCTRESALDWCMVKVLYRGHANELL